MPPVSFLAEVASWLTILVLILLPGIGAAVCWSPILASTRLRSLFRELPLTKWIVPNYVITTITLSIPWVTGLGWAVTRIGSGREIEGIVFLNVSILLAASYVVLLPAIGAIALPRIGIDWDPNRYGVVTWILLVFSSVWYSAIFTAPMVLFGIVISLPT